MSSPQRRTGFRLPWSSPDRDPDKADGDGAAVQEAAERSTPEEPESSAADVTDAVDAPEEAAAETPPTAEAPAATATDADEQPGAEAEPAAEPAGPPEPTAAEAAAEDRSAASDAGEPLDYLRELVAAMRRVAEQARDADLRDLRPRVDERLARFRTVGEQEATSLRERADADVTAIGEWAKAEMERIKTESEARVEARKQELESQLADSQRRAEQGTDEVRRRVADYERGLEEFFGKLGDISDPAAFAAAAKEMPRPPEIEEVSAASDSDQNPGEAADASSNGAALAPGVAPHTSGSTVVVKGLSSFGSITAFKQSLEAVDGVSSVTLSLGPTGEFVYRAVHGDGFDLQGAIAAMERGSAAVERQPDGTLQVTVARGR